MLMTWEFKWAALRLHGIAYEGSSTNRPDDADADPAATQSAIDVFAPLAAARDAAVAAGSEDGGDMAIPRGPWVAVRQVVKDLDID